MEPSLGVEEDSICQDEGLPVHLGPDSTEDNRPYIQREVESGCDDEARQGHGREKARRRW